MPSCPLAPSREQDQQEAAQNVYAQSMAMSGVLGRIMGVLTDYDSPFEVES